MGVAGSSDQGGGRAALHIVCRGAGGTGRSSVIAYRGNPGWPPSRPSGGEQQIEPLFPILWDLGPPNPVVLWGIFWGKLYCLVSHSASQGTRPASILPTGPTVLISDSMALFLFCLFVTYQLEKGREKQTW